MFLHIPISSQIQIKNLLMLMYFKNFFVSLMLKNQTEINFQGVIHIFLLKDNNLQDFSFE